jgi:ABC-type branched-subunit amino acid transport system permease subunit
MTKRKLFGAFCGAAVFAGLLVLLDSQMSPEKFTEATYWLKPLLQGIVMFLIYLLPVTIKNMTWKQLFKKL